MPSTHTSLHYHIVFTTKNREAWFQPGFLPDLHAYLGGIVRTLGGQPHAVGGIEDHVHLAIGMGATHRLADVVREVKSVSSRWVKEKLRRDAFSWQDGYGSLHLWGTCSGRCDGIHPWSGGAPSKG